MFDKWNHIELEFHPKSDDLIFHFNEQSISINRIGIETARRFKFLFGVNTYGKFATTDLPPMKLRNVSIKEKQKEKHFWPLDNTKGNILPDINSRMEAYVTNPLWLRPLHTNWSLDFEREVSGRAQFAFDASSGILYIITRNLLIEYNVILKESRSISYAEGHYLPVSGSQVLYDTINDKLYSYSIDRQQLLEYDFTKDSWNERYVDSLPLTLYWHHNSYLSSADSSIYTFNGYGQLRYRNNVFRYSLNKGRWEEIQFSGDTIPPRYLAGLGHNSDGDTLYIAGGYGSDNGDQLINPHNYYDLFLISLVSREIKKLFDFRLTDEEFCFTNHIIVDDDKNLFYGMVYPKNKPNATLQLIEASLERPDYQYVGTPIPYKFYDIESFADLFYAENISLLVSVIQQNTGSRSVVSIRTLKFPPAVVPEEKPVKGIATYLLTGLIIIVSLVTMMFLFFTKLRRKKYKKNCL